MIKRQKCINVNFHQNKPDHSTLNIMDSVLVVVVLYKLVYFIHVQFTFCKDFIFIFRFCICSDD